MSKIIEKIILKRKQELDGMKKDTRDNEIELQNRQINRKKQRNLMANAALKRQLKINKPSNPQSSAKSPPRKVRLQLIKERQQQKIPSKKVFINIDYKNTKWSHEEEKNSNYYISREDGKIYNKTTKKPSRYIYTEIDGLGLRTRYEIIPFFKTEKLKKE